MKNSASFQTEQVIEIVRPMLTYILHRVTELPTFPPEMEQHRVGALEFFAQCLQAAEQVNTVADFAKFPLKFPAAALTDPFKTVPGETEIGAAAALVYPYQWFEPQKLGDDFNDWLCMIAAIVNTAAGEPVMFAFNELGWSFDS